MLAVGLATPLLLVATTGCEDGSPSGATPDVEPESAIGMNTALPLDTDNVATPMVCPGAIGCESSTGPLRAGAAARTITPVVEQWTDENGDGRYQVGEPFVDENDNGILDPVWLAGFSIGRQATGIHDDMWTRVLVLEQGDTKIALVSLDLVGFFYGDVNAIRTAAEDLAFDHILVTSTHVHEVKDTMGLWGKDAGSSGRDPAYIDFIVEETVAALAEADAALTEVDATFTRQQAAHLIDDSRLPEVKDPTMTAIRFTALEDDTVVAHWLAFGNHPEALGGSNQLITSDYPHYFREEMEAAHPGSVAIFHAGLLGGLMNPLHIAGCPDENGEETCPSGTFELAEYIGHELATLALAGLETDPQPLFDDSADLGFARAPVLMPVENLTFLLALQLGLITRDGFLDGNETERGQRVDGQRLRDLSIDELTSANLRIATEVSLVRLGRFDIVAIPGELYPELFLLREDGGVFIERPEGGDFPDAPFETPVATEVATGRIAVPLNNAGDALGYIIPKAQFDREPPRAYEDDGQYGEENSTGPAAAPVLTEAARALFSMGVE